jgi:hypothetical protein
MSEMARDAAGQGRLCTPSFPNCVSTGPVQLEASWEALTGPSEESPGHHITDWNGSGCKIDFRSGRTIVRSSLATASADGVALSGLFLSQIEAIQGVEVQRCP